MTVRGGFTSTSGLLLIGAIVVFAGTISARIAPAATPKVPAYAAPARAVWLDQGWNDAARGWYHHVSQGTDTIPVPYSWFMALERPIPSIGSPGLFSDSKYLDRFGFIPDPKSASNPAGLPVGFARTAGVNPVNGKPFDELGFTCAACHTGRIDYRGTSILIDGGPAMTDVNKFRTALGFALGLTKLDPARFLRFADRVIGQGRSLRQTLALKRELGKVVIEGIKLQIAEPGRRDNVEEGFGRLDALNRIGNEVFATQMGEKRNYAALSAPVAYPHIWDTHWYDWVQYNSSIEQPMGRNAGEAMGVRALVSYDGRAAPQFTSTVPLDRLHQIETMLAGEEQPTAARRFTGLRSPAWPEAILPRIDRTLAARGATLYEQRCSSCHLPAVGTDAFWRSPAWLPANAAGQRYLRVPVIPVDEIGTDPAQAVDMKNRVIRVPLALGFTDPMRTEASSGVYPYGPALGQIVRKVVDRWYDDHRTSAADRDRMNGYRPDGVRDGLPGPNGTRPAYKARPLNGVWATAPYLHNGAVPTLYDLLSPYAERPKSFWLGNRQFDPVKVGYVTTPLTGGFQLVAVDARTGAQVRGNGNGGHLFETPAPGKAPRAGTIGRTLSPAERAALVEYLKTL
jgi:hypothetical protein